MRKIDYKWVMLLIVSMAYFLAQGTRLIYAAVLPQIKAEFAAGGITDAQLGLVGSCFTLVFGLMMPFAGIFADMYRRKWILVTGALLFSIGIFLSGFASGLGMLLLSYGIMNAIGQALMPPCNSSLIGQLHTDTRGTAFSIYQAAIYLGIVVCSILSGRMAESGEGGWRAAFWIFGAIAIVWAVVMAIFLQDTPNVGKREEVSLGGAVKAFVSKPTALLLMGALGCYFFATYGVKNWAPMFMIRIFPDMAPSQAVFHAVFWFYAGAFVGVTLSGRFSDRLKPRRRFIRFEVELMGLVLCIPFILVISATGSLGVMIGALLLFGFATGVYDSNLYAALLEVIDPKYRAMATGIFGCGGCIIGALGPAVMGLLSDAFSIRAAFASLAAFCLVGCLLILAARLKTVGKDMV